MGTLQNFITETEDALADCHFIDNTWQQAEREQKELKERLTQIVKDCYYAAYAEAIQDMNEILENAKRARDVNR